MEVNNIISALSRLVHPPKHSTPIDQCVNHWLKNAKRILTIVNSDPAIVVPIIHIETPMSEISRHVLLLALFGKLNQFNEHYLQHIIAALLATHWITTNSVHEERKALISFLTKRQLFVWRDIIRLQKAFANSASLRRMLADLRLTQAQRLSVISRLCATRSSNSSASTTFEIVVRNIAPLQRILVSNLATLFTRAVPGAKVFVGGKAGVVVDIQKDHAFVIALSDNDIDGTWQPFTRVMFPKPLFIPYEHLVALYSQTSDNRQYKGGNGFLPATYAIQAPPTSLTAIIDELQKRDCEIPSLCEKIENVESFNLFLMHTASQDNRLQLQVKNIKQAVMTYGIERVGDMLIQFALMERLTQKQFPLMSTCKQFTLLCCAIASSLASMTNTKFSPQSAALTMTFLCSPLFTLPGLKIARKLPVNPEKPFSFNHAFYVKSEIPWITSAGELAGNWHQSATWRAVIHHCNKQNEEIPSSLRKEHALMQLAFALGKISLFHGNIFTLGQDITFKTLLIQLSLSQKDIQSIITSQSALLFCPLA